MSIKSAILTLKEVAPPCCAVHNFRSFTPSGRPVCETCGFELEPPPRRRRQADYSHMDPADLTEEGVPHDNYESPCLEAHPFDGRPGRAGEY